VNEVEELVEGLLTDEELLGYKYKVSTSPPLYAFTDKDNTLFGGNHLFFIRMKEILKAQRDLTRREKDAEIAELKEQVEYMHEAWEVLIEVTEAECQERVEGIKRVVLQSIANEPEYPSDMPDELWRELDGNRINVSKAMQSTVRLTKNGITERFLQALKEGVK